VLENNIDNHYNQTVKIVRDAIPRMSALQIPITPENYAIWYEYLSDSNQALCQEMDALLNRDEPISNVEMQSLYQRYIENRNEKLEFAKTALSQLISSLRGHVKHYTGFSNELTDIAIKLDENISSEDFNILIDQAVNATKTALNESEALRSNLSSMAAEMEIIQDKLVRSEEEARADALTGLSNRLAFQETLADLSKTVSEDSHAPCLLLVDIDYFKKVNDTHGHLIGDQVLASVAQEIKESVRGRDMVARFGGEEFAVLVRDTPRSGCKIVAENIRANIEAKAIQLSNSPAGDTLLVVTASVGGAFYRDKETIEDFLDRADRSLYASKENGRNKVTWEIS